MPMVDDIGYREVGYSVSQLKNILKRMDKQKTGGKKVDSEELDMVMTNINLADDEVFPSLPPSFPFLSFSHLKIIGRPGDGI